jgi:TonB family protein
LLVEWHPWHREFLRNLGDLFRPTPTGDSISSSPGTFWRDVFVQRGLPWPRFAQSACYHALFLAAMAAWTRYVIIPAPATRPTAFHSADVVYYSPEEYLPPLDTGVVHAPSREKGDPGYAKQPIISVPPEADNRSQTIVAPPKIKLQHEVPLPNVVAWSQPSIPVQAAPERIPGELRLRSLPTPVIAPPPEVRAVDARRMSLPAQAPVAPPPQVEIAANRSARTLSPAVVAPPPVVTSTVRRTGEITIGHSAVVPPAPKLPMSEQRSLAAAPANGGGAVVPPPPSLPAEAGKSGGRLIALNLHPTAPSVPVEPPGGNRRGKFAATPEGRVGASGTPDVAGASQSGMVAGHSGEENATTIPPGLLVGSAPEPKAKSAVAGNGHGGNGNGSSGGGTLVADATPPRVSAAHPSAREIPEENESPLERQIFHDRKFYAMTVNLPNLNSAGGSWVIHFAEQQDKSNGNLSAPVPTQSVDPAYPAELMKQNVEGTVTLYAVIGSDGSVSGVRVLEGVDDRLDHYAVVALSQWHFRPATRNGTAVPLEAVVMIPFRASRHRF